MGAGEKQKRPLILKEMGHMHHMIEGSKHQKFPVNILPENVLAKSHSIIYRVILINKFNYGVCLCK